MTRFINVGVLCTFCTLLSTGCGAAGGDENVVAEDPGEEVMTEEDPLPPPPDDFDSQEAPPIDDNYMPKPLTATRLGIFYQVSRDVIDFYQSGTGLPKVPGHAYIITQSHATAYASKVLADLVHRRADFYYAPAFDIFDAKHIGWNTTTDAQLKAWAHEFRDTAIARHADLFAFNELPTTTGTNDNVRVRVAKILRWINEPDAKGRRLYGVVYFTQRPSMAVNWDTPANAFFKAIDDTSVALVAEFYHSNGYLCANSEAALANHYFSLRKWLVASGEPAKLSIASKKFTILHSSRFNAGPSGWAGGNSDLTSLANFQRSMSRAAKVTRMTEGGTNRIAFGPTSSNTTQFGVHPRIAALFRWHYGRTTAQPTERPCIDNFGGNCNCE